MSARVIAIRGAAEHNLRDLDLDLPHGAVTCVSGVSGSGKSSLVYDTVYAEARRRYLMTLEASAANALRRLPRPRFRQITGLSPAVAVAQSAGRQSPRSTVATLAGIHDYLRVLFARLGSARCLRCGAVVAAHRFEEVYETAAGLAEGTRLVVMAPRHLGAEEDRQAWLAAVDRTGYRRLRAGGQMRLLEEVRPQDLSPGRLDIVVDRMVVKADTMRRLKGSLQAALEVGDGQVALLILDVEEVRTFAVRPACSSCGTPFPALTPSLFSHNSPSGACPRCRGLGSVRTPGYERLFGAGRLSLEEALGPLWREFGHRELLARLGRFCERAGLDPEAAVSDWPATVQQRLWTGERGRGGFVGMRRWLERQAGRATGAELDWFDERLDDVPCDDCGGSRLSSQALAVRAGDHTIASLTRQPVRQALESLAALDFGPTRQGAAEALLARVRTGLQALCDLGLEYLPLDRGGPTLSSGEFQRVRLAAALGSGLTQVLYVLDEPTAGLHARDTGRLLASLQGLRDRGNTVLVVEHDLELLAGADYLVDLGPGAGSLGGRLVAAGTPAEVARTDSPTGRHLACSRGGTPGCWRRRPVGAGGWLHLRGASGHNLQEVDADLPLGNLVCVTGVSGSGKSSLVHQTLYPALAARLQAGETRPLAHRSCEGAEQLERVLAVDQRPIGRTSRSNAATYTGILGSLRGLFAELPEARVRGYRPAHFSFNAPEGCCPECAGSGTAEVRRGLYGDLEVPCPSCGGRRYNREVLEVRYRQLSIAEVLELDVAGALEVFGAIPEVARRLRLLDDLGLGYLHLGQSASSLSGGEAQRVKLAGELGRPRRARTLYILDEPTTGLHAEDIHHLAELLQRLVDEDNTVLVVEHNVELIAAADYVIDLGPEAGAEGGRIVAAGTPEQVAAAPDSATARHLASRLAKTHS
ncbi:MAG: excinuclease ABC subunit UvrA [Gemmatimonadota bacterium]